MIPLFLLPANVQLNGCSITIGDDTLDIQASNCQPESVCPVCGCKSARIHSRYIRMFSDLPASGYRVKVSITAKRYFCDNPNCSRKIFTERFAYEIASYNRRFNRCNELLGNMALELGGNKGATISSLAHLPVSPSTILRIVKRKNIRIPKITSGIIGVDDWAFRKGNTYGTIIVDLQEKRVIDLLPDREAETLCCWLKEHPEIIIVSRDRGGPYAKGARDGAPQAIQIADRFHLLMNLADAIKKMFHCRGKELNQLYVLYNEKGDSRDNGLLTDQQLQLKEWDQQTKEIEASNTEMNTAQQFRFDKVKELNSQGYAIKAIARTLHIQRATIRKYIRMETLPVREGKQSTNFASFQGFLLQENNRNKTYKELYGIIKEKGFRGRYSQFCNNMNALLKEHKMAPTARKASHTPVKTWSSRQLSILIQSDKKNWSKEDKDFMEMLYNKMPVVKTTAELVVRFKQLFQKKEEGSLKTWIEDAMKPTSGIRSFAKGLRSDFEAVNNAVVTPYSNGQLEGQVNRLKNIKRRMYGRAKFDLLRKMVIFKSG